MMVRPRMNRVVRMLLATWLLALWPGGADASIGTSFTSIRYGYALTLAPGWVLARGDCAAYAMVWSKDTSSFIEVLVINGAISNAALRHAEERALRTTGQLRGVVTYSTMHLRNATYQTARAQVGHAGVMRDVLVAGIVRNQHTYLVIAAVGNPSSRSGQRNARAERDMLVSLTFVKPAPAGSFICSALGISKKRPSQTVKMGTATPTATVRRTSSPTRTPTLIPSSTATATEPVNTISPTTTPSSTVTATETPSLTVTATSSATSTPTLPSTPTETATWTATPTQTPVPNSIPTAGTTDNGCPITSDQAAGEAHLLALLNADRATAGVDPLALLTSLSVGSRDHSCDMGQHNNLSHTGSDGSNPFQRMRATGTTFNMAGENIGMAFGYGITGSLDSIDQQMMAEPIADGDHHWNIINSGYHRIGIGVIDLGGTVWVTEDFVD